MCLTFRLQITLLGRPMHQLLAGYHEAGKMGTRCFCFGSRLVLSVSKTMAKCSIYSWVVETVPRETQGKSVAFVWIISQCSQCSFCAIAQLHFDLFELDSSLFTFLIKQWSEKLRFLKIYDLFNPGNSANSLFVSPGCSTPSRPFLSPLASSNQYNH